MSIIKSIALIISLSIFSNLEAQKATYIANGGVLIENGESKILIDAIFEDGKGKFLTPSSDQLQRIISGKSPYNGLDLLLVTHAHKDHFSGPAGIQILATQKNLKMITTPQAIDSMKSATSSFQPLESRAITYPLSKSWKTYDGGLIKVKSAYTRHPGKTKAVNMVFLISVNGKKILHLGDADMDLERFKALKLNLENIDIAFIPFWYLSGLYGTELVQKYINTKKIIATHFPRSGSEKSIAKIKSFNPSAIIMQSSGQSVTF